MKQTNRTELIFCKDHDIIRRWRAYFEEILNRDDPPITTDVNEQHEELDINVDTISKEEIKSVLKEIKNGKAPGIDNIPAELLKADTFCTTMAVNMLHDILLSTWDTERVPNDLKVGIIIKLPKKGI